MEIKKPELYPNSTAGKEPDVLAIIKEPTDWLYSNKADGGRVQNESRGVYGRSLKRITSIHIQAMWKGINEILQLSDSTVLEAEFYSEEMNFAEIMHFFRSEDVTSAKSRKTHQTEWNKTTGGTKTYTKKVKGEDVEAEWEFPGRDVEWLCTWHDSLKFYAFNIMDHDDLELTKEERSKILEYLVKKHASVIEGDKNDLMLLKQNEFTHVDALYQAYDQALMDGFEGLVVMRKDCKYKYGRHSANYTETFKLKEDNLEFDGVILYLEEGTEVIEGTAKKTNELGRSVTSKLKDDRIPSGLCKGFRVLMEDGNELTVSLKDFPHPARRAMLLEPEKYVGQTIRFTGMGAVKEGGCPRHAHFTKGNFRDAK